MQPAQVSTVFLPGQASGPAPDAAGRSAGTARDNSGDSFNLVMARSQGGKAATGTSAPGSGAAGNQGSAPEPGETGLETAAAGAFTTSTNTTGTGPGNGLAATPAGAPRVSQLDASAQRPDPAAANPFLAHGTAPALLGDGTSPTGLGDYTVPAVPGDSAVPPAPVNSAVPAGLGDRAAPLSQAPVEHQVQTGGKPVPAKVVADTAIPADVTTKPVPQTQIADAGAKNITGKPLPGIQISEPQGQPPAATVVPLAKPAAAPPLNAPPQTPALKSAENSALDAQTMSIAAGQTRPDGSKSQPNAGGKSASAAKPAVAGSSPAAGSAAGLQSATAAPDTVQPASELQNTLPKAPQAPAPASQPVLDGGLARQPAAEPALPFRSDAELRLSQPNLQANIDRSAQTTPRFTPQSAQQLAAQITRRFDAGSRVFDIRLDPAELGRVDVRLELMPDQRVQAILSAERQETLAELQRSAKDLQRALSEAGLDLADDGLSFQLADDDDPSGFADESSEGVVNVYAETDDILLDGAGTDQPPVSAYGFLLTGRDRVNVMA